jgi:hypothetical protein
MTARSAIETMETRLYSSAAQVPAVICFPTRRFGRRADQDAACVCGSQPMPRALATSGLFTGRIISTWCRAKTCARPLAAVAFCAAAYTLGHGTLVAARAGAGG